MDLDPDAWLRYDYYIQLPDGLFTLSLMRKREFAVTWNPKDNYNFQVAVGTWVAEDLANGDALIKCSVTTGLVSQWNIHSGNLLLFTKFRDDDLMRPDSLPTLSTVLVRNSEKHY